MYNQLDFKMKKSYLDISMSLIVLFHFFSTIKSQKISVTVLLKNCEKLFKKINE